MSTRGRVKRRLVGGRSWFRACLPLVLSLCLAGAACSSKHPPGAVPGRAGAGPPSSLGSSVAARAGGMVGAHYKYGGESPSEGFDCSGLAWWAHAASGVEIPRVSWQQWQGGLDSSRNPEPGDLVFFRLAKGAKSLHVGVYLGRGEFVHSPKSGSTVRLDRMDNPYWKARFIGARRYVS